MAIWNDRVGERLEGFKRNRKILVSPEGVPLSIEIAGNGERITAFLIDAALMTGVIVFLYFLILLVFFSGSNLAVGITLILFIAFIVRNLYFIHFELAWQGRTPGKKACGLRVINRNGGELSPSAVIARNLTREVEFFLPLTLVLSLDAEGSIWQDLTLLGWVLCISALPLFNKGRLRAGDLIGGTQVIAMPKRLLLDDLTGSDERGQSVNRGANGDVSGGKNGGGPVGSTEEAAREAFVFNHEQLAVYGVFELQVLEEVLRRSPSVETDRLLAEVCKKIRRKIGWNDAIPTRDIRRFLNDFYTAQRAELEREKLMGHIKADQNTPPKAEKSA